MSDLTTLIDRVRGLTGPDREVDAAIDAALRIGGKNMREKAPWAWDNFPVWRPASRAGMCEVVHSNGKGGLIWDSLPLTASIDAVVALIERELPGVHWSISKSYGPHSPMRSFGDGDFTALCGSFGDPKRAAHDAPALALLLAFLNAMKEKSVD